MEAIALRSPDGLVYAYACGQCHHISTSGEYMHDHSPSEVASIAASSKQGAEACCRCRLCGGYCPRDPAPPAFRTCAACWEGGERERQEMLTERWKAQAEANAAAREASLALALDREAAIALEVYMRDMSEETYCAGWLSGLEHSLWRMLSEGGDHTFGIGTVTATDCDRMRRLSEKAGGWWTYDRFVPIAAWLMLAEAGCSPDDL